MSILDDIRAEIATLTRLVPTPAEPLGYGVDLSCVADLTADMREASEPRQVLAEHCVRMLTTDRDSIPDAPGRGWNIRRLLNRAYTKSELAAQEGQARTELEHDDRIDTALVTLLLVRETRTATLRVRITPIDPSLGPFEFVATILADGQAFLELLS